MCRDCYVAATGIPKYHTDHAVVMVQFAHKISKEMTKMTQMLETTLGPDTSDLLLRIGIHTGPVTAGVIRGEKARFQLFGVSYCASLIFLVGHQVAYLLPCLWIVL